MDPGDVLKGINLVLISIYLFRFFSQILAPILVVTFGISLLHTAAVQCDGDPGLRVLQTCRLHGYDHVPRGRGIYMVFDSILLRSGS